MSIIVEDLRARGVRLRVMAEALSGAAAALAAIDVAAEAEVAMEEALKAAQAVNDVIDSEERR